MNEDNRVTSGKTGIDTAMTNPYMVDGGPVGLQNIHSFPTAMNLLQSQAYQQLLQHQYFIQQHALLLQLLQQAAYMANDPFTEYAKYVLSLAQGADLFQPLNTNSSEQLSRVSSASIVDSAMPMLNASAFPFASNPIFYPFGLNVASFPSERMPFPIDTDKYGTLGTDRQDIHRQSGEADSSSATSHPSDDTSDLAD
jgi:hypothetical protein